MTHESRINAIAANLEEAMARFEARLSSLTAEQAERPRADGGWSAAQIAWHVAAVNAAFMSLIDGSRPAAQPASAGFIERTWEEIGRALDEKLDAPARVTPTGPVSHGDALSKVKASGAALAAAIRALDPARGPMTVDSPVVGRVSLYQVGEWAVIHVIRHNKQMKALAQG